MSALAPTVQAFFTQRLIQERNASPHTIAAYRDTIRLLLRFAAQRRGREPSMLDIADLDADTVAEFLEHLQTARGNSARTRNARLAAIHSLYRYAALRHPEHAQDIQRVLSIPPKRTDRALVTFLDQPEIEALLAAPDRTTWTGRRDHALLMLAIQTGLRASELTILNLADVQLDAAPHVTCEGKGRKQRITPLTRTTSAILRVWLAERAGHPHDPLFPTIRGRRLTRDALERRLALHVAHAAIKQPSLTEKSVTLHTLRHTAAMQLLHAGIDTTVIALWLGHERVETTQIYLHADLALKEKALARTKPPDAKPGRYRPPDTLLAFLEAL
ncbi:MAG: tyrosine-type recombinase/integrase [Solirubrobacteraceae bacterium]